MLRPSWVLAAVTLAACSAPSPSRMAVATNGAAVSRDAVVIGSTGSTNTWGYTIVVGADGRATFTQGGAAGSQTLDPALTRRLFADVAAAEPLGRLPARHCMKSVSFGTTVTIAHRGATTPDLICPVDEAERRLARDAHEIAARLHVGNRPRRGGPGPRPVDRF